PLPEELLRKITILTPNETEAESLTGITVTDKKTAEEAASILHRKGVPIVIITMDAKGVYLSAPECKKMIKSFKVKAVDSTAAGDVFNGALATALSQELGLLEAIRFAIAAAAISVTRLGAQPSVPTRKEIEKMLKS
ncbi:MAG: bifunctional hydroxymethylpyrimidine kinase/phosphomethylpyrimidine kinase, partial [Verrucomicrobia bacterium]|nr:bifunctional hydroxymethylpyrimidine kinase/phosphomethylpyrimidine kinase [Verrucomicrobiota bacterium]